MAIACLSAPHLKRPSTLFYHTADQPDFHMNFWGTNQIQTTACLSSHWLCAILDSTLRPIFDLGCICAHVLLWRSTQGPCPLPDECFTSPWFFMLFIIAIYVLLCMCQCGFHGIHVEVRGEAVGVGSLPTHVSSRSSAVIGRAYG